MLHLIGLFGIYCSVALQSYMYHETSAMFHQRLFILRNLWFHQQQLHGQMYSFHQIILVFSQETTALHQYNKLAP